MELHPQPSWIQWYGASQQVIASAMYKVHKCMLCVCCSFLTVGNEMNLCLPNGGKGPCQQVCTYTEPAYHCSCFPEWTLSVNKHSCHKTGQGNCVNNCSGHGVCLHGGYCDCQFGWRGPSCSEAVCYAFADCSGHGDCVAPNQCACLISWGGVDCSIDLCSIHRSCQTCTSKIGCGWCDSTKKCLPGGGFGPDDSSTAPQCVSWLYYSCNVAVVDKSSVSNCSDQVRTIDCSQHCIDNTDLKTSGPGSYEFCSVFKTLCHHYARCFQSALTPNLVCPTWNEDKCRFGIPVTPRQYDDVPLIARRRRNAGFSAAVCSKYSEFLVCVCAYFTLVLSINQNKTICMTSCKKRDGARI